MLPKNVRHFAFTCVYHSTHVISSEGGEEEEEKQCIEIRIDFDLRTSD